MRGRLSMIALRNYQRHAVDRIEGPLNYRALLAFDIGLGKTVTALELVRRHPDILPAIVVCPASVKHHWEQETMAHLGLQATILDTRTPPTQAGLHGPLKIAIINFDILPYWIDWLRSLEPRLVVIDEIQNLGNHTAKRTKAVRKLCDAIPNILMLSGTPLLNRPIELWPGLSILRPDLYTSRWSFGERFCNPRLVFGRWEFKGARHLDVLHRELVQDVMIRCRLRDVLSELPRQSRHVRVLPLSDPGLYRRAERGFLDWAKSAGYNKTNGNHQADRLRLMSHLKQLAARLKLPAVLEWVNQMLEESNEKLVLFCWHRKCAAALQKGSRAKSVVITGECNRHERQQAIRQFRNDSRTRVFIGNIKAAGVGLDGLQIAQTCAFVELAWTPGAHSQAEGRLNRMGQERPSRAYYLVAANTIEATLLQLLQSKQGVISATLDGGPQDNDLDVFNRLEAELTSDHARPH